MLIPNLRPNHDRAVIFLQRQTSPPEVCEPCSLLAHSSWGPPHWFHSVQIAPGPKPSASGFPYAVTLGFRFLNSMSSCFLVSSLVLGKGCLGDKIIIFKNLRMSYLLLYLIAWVLNSFPSECWRHRSSLPVSGIAMEGASVFLILIFSGLLSPSLSLSFWMFLRSPQSWCPEIL